MLKNLLAMWVMLLIFGHHQRITVSLGIIIFFIMETTFIKIIAIVA
jgi:hypothetical protein